MIQPHVNEENQSLLTSERVFLYIQSIKYHKRISVFNMQWYIVSYMNELHQNWLVTLYKVWNKTVHYKVKYINRVLHFNFIS